MKVALSIYDYYLLISVLYFNFLLYHDLLPCKDVSSLFILIFSTIFIYVIFPKIYLYFFKKSVYKNNLKITNDSLYLYDIKLENFKKSYSLYCKEYDSIIILGVVKPSKFKYKSKIFLINKSNLKNIHLNILKEFYEPFYAKL